ncbi:mechanosensitive ion channel family protein [Corynebacterium sp.]|uniref:mechanosensitive ion channel family protein n=1 Tax=Corynebacterium sp. TaxID=1720 RepID=UPI0026E03D5B|nr:mechanosensitive ion channel family protein [Corynebacterium sp.]MDO5511393.1 mechanosensitive ion channel family protein [Corynebacterium sp.]
MRIIIHTGVADGRMVGGMLDFALYLLTRAWSWMADQGLTLAILLTVALLVPRVGRFAQRWLARGVEETTDADESKTRLALTGVGVYIFQLIAFFLILIFFLQTLGFSLAGAAIPATVVSAAIGFGAQSIIADFLAGFFILTEKQFGVGDWVRFEGNGIQVEGTVIQITMRSTRIRTLAQETVIIPNSTARVSINASNYWSRAVVVMPVPLLGSTDTQEAIDRSEAATRRALGRPNVAEVLIGELDVHPAVNVTPPATVGMPWTMDMRFMIQVEAGMQWLVERAIRTEILDEFWNEYGSATTITGEVKDRVDTVTTAAFDRTPLIDVPLSGPQDSAGDQEVTVPAGFADEEGRDPAVVERGVQGDEPEDTTDQQTPAGGVFRNDSPTSGWRRFASFGGRVRASTTYLFGILFILLLLKTLTVDAGEDGPTGVLAPRTPTPQTTVESEPAPAPVPEQTWPEQTWQEPTPAPTPQQPAPAEPTTAPQTQTTAPEPGVETQAPATTQTPVTPDAGGQ